MRSEQEVNRAIEQYADMVLRLCMVCLNNSADAEDVFQTVNQGLALSRERLGADAVLIPKYAPATGDELLFTATPENIYMPIEVVEQARELDGIAVCMIIAVTAVMALLAKKEYKGLIVVNAVAAVMLFLVFTSLIGVCASETMRCQITKIWGIGAAAAIFASSLINLISGKEGQIPD